MRKVAKIFCNKFIWPLRIHDQKFSVHLLAVFDLEEALVEVGPAVGAAHDVAVAVLVAAAARVLARGPGRPAAVVQVLGTDVWKNKMEQ